MLRCGGSIGVRGYEFTRGNNMYKIDLLPRPQPAELGRGLQEALLSAQGLLSPGASR